MKYFCACIFVFFGLHKTFSQTTDSGYDYYITTNGNLYLPINNPEKGTYPILWYDKETTPKVLIGGFGVGIAAWKHRTNKVSLKGQGNFSRHVYWGEPIIITDDSGNPIQDYVAGVVDYSLDLTALAHYSLNPKISVGTGIGMQVMLASLIRTPDVFDAKSTIALNKFYKRLMPVIPVELTYKSVSKSYSIRYEQGLLNRYKSNIAAYKKDSFGLLSFEIGFKIKD